MAPSTPRAPRDPREPEPTEADPPPPPQPDVASSGSDVRSRGTGMRRGACVVAALAGLAGTLSLADSWLRPPRPPNVLLVVMDTTRADRCSLLGYARPTTPYVAAFAQDAVTFTQAWSPSPWTMPAHAALFSGRRPDTLGMLDDEPRGLPEGTPTLALLLDGQGWETGCFTNNAWIGAHSGLTTGFGVVRAIHAEPGGASARRAHDAALQWMRERHAEGRRFFAFVNDLEPHAPWNPPDDERARFVHPALPAEAVDAARTLEYPRTYGPALAPDRMGSDVRRAASDLYDGEVASLDAEVGRLLDGVRAAGLLDETLVIVLSDHGEGLGDHGSWEHGIDLHREALHVPLVVRPPGGGARRVDDVVRLEDVLPTVLAACGIEAPGPLDGEPLLDAPAGGRVAIAADKGRRAWYEQIEDLYGPGSADPLRRRTSSVFDGRHHLLLDDRGEVLLYDVEADPAETRDLSASRPEVVERLRGLLAPR